MRTPHTPRCHCPCDDGHRCNQPADFTCDACNRKLCQACLSVADTPVGWLRLCDPCGKRIVERLGSGFGEMACPTHARLASAVR